MVRDRHLRRALPALAALFALFLSAGALFAKPRVAPAPALEAAFARLWRTFPLIFRSPRGLAKEGSALDPFGAPKPQSAAEPVPGSTAVPGTPSPQ